MAISVIIFSKLSPPATGGSSQIKRFTGGSDIPERLFFDMRLVYR